MLSDGLPQGHRARLEGSAKSTTTRSDPTMLMARKMRASRAIDGLRDSCHSNDSTMTRFGDSHHQSREVVLPMSTLETTHLNTLRRVRATLEKNLYGS